MYTIGRAITLFRLNSGMLLPLFVGTLLMPHDRIMPDWLPFHPHRWWVHMRAVFLPMSYIYGIRYQIEENDLILSLREVCIILHRAYTPAYASL